MRPENIQVGTRYRNPRIEALVGSKVVYLGVGDENGPKSLVIIEGVGVGTFVVYPHDKASRSFWNHVVPEKKFTSVSVATQIAHLLSMGANPNNKRKFLSISRNSKVNSIVRNTAKRLAQEI
jgi:hypothetical protein